jgi:hypothetical protein
MSTVERRAQAGEPARGPAWDGANAAQPDPFGHQRALAASLIRNLGYDVAVDACRRNGWCGVLKVLLEDKVLLEEKPDPAPA